MLSLYSDESFMKQALFQAQMAMDEGEVPVGAVVVKDNKVIGKGRNCVERSNDPTSHAEVLAIGAACNAIGDWRLDGCTLYATLEPCPMCAGAAVNARISKIVYGSPDKRLGACGSCCDLISKDLLNRKIEVIPGIMSEDCLGILQMFFKVLREKKK